MRIDPFPTLRESLAARLTKHQHRLLLTRSNKIRHRRAAGQQRRSNTSARSLTGQLAARTACLQHKSQQNAMAFRLLAARRGLCMTGATAAAAACQFRIARLEDAPE